MLSVNMTIIAEMYSTEWVLKNEDKWPGRIRCREGPTGV